MCTFNWRGDPRWQRVMMSTIMSEVLNTTARGLNAEYEAPRGSEASSWHQSSSMSPPITLLMIDEHTGLSLFRFCLCLRCSIFYTKSNPNALFCCGLMPNPFPSAPEEKISHEYKATPHTLCSHSLPRLHTPSSLAPVPGLRPRLHAMLREVLVLIQLTPPPTHHPCLLSLFSSSPFL